MAIRLVANIELVPTLKSILILAGCQRNPTERQNEKTRQKAGFSEISKAAKTTFETLYGAGTGVEPGTY
ncbi:hypothetical protein CU668_12970 [Pseudomonas syringae pv. actinidifoliorum]|nr:hypothetical protein [Pseudomonas syringae pv. actinidifoliorum]